MKAPRNQRHRDRLTMDLLAWEPVAPVKTFTDEPRTQAASLHGKFCRAMAVAIEDCAKDREAVAAEMGAYLGEDFTKASLDAYLAESKTSHVIQITRFAALIHATDDMRLLSLLPELFGHVVIAEEHADLLEIALLTEKRDKLNAALELKTKKVGRP